MTTLVASSTACNNGSSFNVASTYTNTGSAEMSWADVSSSLTAHMECDGEHSGCVGSQGSNPLFNDGRALEYAHNSWDFINHYEYLCMMGLFFTLRILEWELECESPNVGTGLLVHQPLNYSHTEFTGGLQRWSLILRQKQTQTLNELVCSFPTN